MASLSVLVCGGGNAAHVFGGQLAARHVNTCLLTTFPGEAERLSAGGLSDDHHDRSHLGSQRALRAPHITVKNWPLDDSGTKFGILRGSPTVCVSFEEAFRNTTRYDAIILALPAFAHDTYLAGIAPYLKLEDTQHKPTVICAAVAQGGFDLAARAALNEAEVTVPVVIAGFETLPWACRILRPGREVEVLGAKETVDVAISFYPNQTKASVQITMETLQTVVGFFPPVKLASGFLGISLMDINCLWHPTLMYHRWQGWNGQETFTEAPLLYEECSDEVGESLMAISDEVAAVCKKIRNTFPGVLLDDLSSARSCVEWFLRSYGDEPGLDKSSVATMMRTNRAYHGLRHPMKHRVKYDEHGSAIPEANAPLVPDFSHRYLTEDVPFGLVVLRGIAELAGVPTPTIDKILLWAQNASGVRYLVRRTINLEDAEADFDQSEANTSNFTLRGEHVFRTRCPQRFGWFELNHFMVDNGYVTSASTSNTEGTLFGSTRKTSATDITKSAGAA